MSVKVLAFSGSTRKASWNTRLVRIAARLAEKQGAQVTVRTVLDFDLPLMNEDLEAEHKMPEAAIALKETLKAHDAFLIACPEYNSSITPALKNAIDWASRPREGERPHECTDGKIVGLMAASPGALGGLRGLDHVREIMNNVRAHIVPGLVGVARAHEVIAEEGLNAPPLQTALENLVATTVRTAAALRG